MTSKDLGLKAGTARAALRRWAVQTLGRESFTIGDLKRGLESGELCRRRNIGEGTLCILARRVGLPEEGVIDVYRAATSRVIERLLRRKCEYGVRVFRKERPYV